MTFYGFLGDTMAKGDRPALSLIPVLLYLQIH